MKSVKVLLNTFEKVRSFVNLISGYEYRFEFISESCVVDAKSIMGIFSLNLTEPLHLNIIAEDDVDHLFDQLSLYMV